MFGYLKRNRRVRRNIRQRPYGSLVANNISLFCLWRTRLRITRQNWHRYGSPYDGKHNNVYVQTCRVGTSRFSAENRTARHAFRMYRLREYNFLFIIIFLFSSPGKTCTRLLHRYTFLPFQTHYCLSSVASFRRRAERASFARRRRVSSATGAHTMFRWL